MILKLSILDSQSFALHKNGTDFHHKFNSMSNVLYDVVRQRIYGYYHCIPGEIISHFYGRQSSESPILTILEEL